MSDTQTDHVIAIWILDTSLGMKLWAWNIVSQPNGAAINPNFLLVCDAGDYSRFHTLKECMERPYIEGGIRDEFTTRPSGYYKIVER